MRKREAMKLDVKLLGIVLTGSLWMACAHQKAAPPGSPGQSKLFEVRVQAGETLTELGQRFEVPETTIQRINRLQAPDEVKPGQILYIPISEKALKSSDLRGRSRIVSSHLPLSATKLPPSSPKQRRAALYSQYEQLEWPVDGRLGSAFGLRNGRPHEGIDIFAKRGTKIRSAHSGRVEFTGWKRGYGWTVLINHNSFRTLYAHCSKIYVKKNQWVKKGEDIALVGASGNAEGIHLHFEYLTMNDKPLDPMPHFSRYAH